MTYGTNNVKLVYTLFRLESVVKSNVMRRQTTWNNRVLSGNLYLLEYDLVCEIGCRYRRLGTARCFRLQVEMVGSEPTHVLGRYLGKNIRDL